MNRYKIIFSDIDGTLLDSKQDVLPKTRQIILALHSKGIPFILVSGRMPHSVLNVQKKIGFSQFNLLRYALREKRQSHN